MTTTFSLHLILAEKILPVIKISNFNQLHVIKYERIH